MIDPFAESRDGAQRLFTRLEEITGFRHLDPHRKEFEAAFDRAMLLDNLAPEGGARRDWRSELIAALGSVGHGLAACHYHLSRLEEVERQVQDMLLREKAVSLLQDGVVIGRGTPTIDFEYHAFAFAIRRTLEYAAQSVGAFFKTQAYRIRDLERSISRGSPEDLRDRIQQRLRSSLPALRDILPDDSQPPSVRDRLAHYEAVPCGVLNIGRRGDKLVVGFWGGGEKLNWFGSGPKGLVPGEEKEFLTLHMLSPVLKRQLSKVEGLVMGMYSDLGLRERDTYGTETGRPRDLPRNDPSGEPRFNV